MENYELMTNEEVMEATEEVVSTNSGNGGKALVGIGLAALVGGLAYKFAIKPYIAKRKAKKEAEKANDAVTADFEDVDEEVEE